MRATFPLGRILGVRVGVHWSVVLIFALIAFGLAAGRLPQTHPGHAWPLYTLIGLVTAVIFFASLLAHELAHAVVARRNGVAVDDIVLWLLGGATRIRTEAPNPGADLRIAGVGPLVSLILGGVFALLAWLLYAVSGSGPVVEGVVWLAAINILLAVFNAIPAAPLDGGRLLRAFLWRRGGDRLRATEGAARAGQVFGWLLVAFGLASFLFTTYFGGLWLALIGWFLVMAASAEGRQARLREVLAGVPVRQTMSREPVTVPAGMRVSEFLSDVLMRSRHSAFPVVEVVPEGGPGRPVGLVTLEQAGQVPAQDRESTTMAEIMQSMEDTQVVGPDEPISDVLPRMENGAARRIVVVDDGVVVGILSPSDVSRMVRMLTSQQRHPAPGGWGQGPGG
ncbi:site-2 protease family protein [Streptomyces xiamenensis]|uniref:site-2 protease family protein n=1 Tax=Streptomyces xiamenensis TaxID=408015 RepID=UPI0036E913FB